jgi:hypothetical protein
VWSGFIWLRIGTSGGSCEQGIELSDSIKGVEFIEWLSDLASQGLLARVVT